MQDSRGVNTFLVLLVVFAATQALIWIPLIIWLRLGYRAARNRLSSQIAAETVLRPPEKARYEGATAPNYPRLRTDRRTGVADARNNGMIALSRRRLVFFTVTRKSIEIPVSEIGGVHEGTVLLRTPARGGTTHHLVIELRSGGQVGFYVADNAAWCHAIKDASSQ